MKFKIQLLLLSAGLFLFNPVIAQGKSKTAAAAPPALNITLPAFNLTCNQELLQSHGLEGLVEPQIIPLESCGKIRRSCCSRADEVRFGEQWAVHQEGARIDAEYKQTLQTYHALMNQLSRVSHFAEIMVDSIPKRLSNCKMLARRITQFEIEEIKKPAKRNLKEMVEFITTAHKGFYCAICNFDNHPFLLNKEKTMVLSTDFCRQLAKNTISPLLTFEADILTLLNIVTKFLSSCNGQGILNPDAEFPPELVFVRDRVRSRRLRHCFERSNIPGQWLASCMNICQAFHPSRIANYLVPLRVKMQAHIDYMGTRLLKLRTEKEVGQKWFDVLTPPTPTIRESKGKDVKEAAPQATKEVKVDAKAQAVQTTTTTTAAPAKARMLNDKAVAGAANGSAATAKPVTPNLYRLVPGAKVNTAEWAVAYRRNGISLYDEGRAARFEKRLIAKLKRLQLLERMNVTAFNMTNWMIKNVTAYLESPEASFPRELSSVKVWSVVTAFAALMIAILG